MRVQRETLLAEPSGIEEMEFAACPRCGCSDGKVVVEGRDYLCGIEGSFFGWQCSECGLQYQNPRPTAECLAKLYPSFYGPHTVEPSASELPAQEVGGRAPSNKRRFAVRVRQLLPPAATRLFYALRYGTGIESLLPSPAEKKAFLSGQMGYTHLKSPLKAPLSRSMIRECGRVAGIDLVPFFVPEGRLLEIGCATGARLQEYRESGWTHLHGIELTEQAATQARQRGFSVSCEQVETALNRFPNAYFDVIVSSMVLEHLYDPFTVVLTIAQKLKPGGEFLFSTITRDSLDARMFGKYWSGYDFPRHMVYLRKKDIREMVSNDFDNVEWFHQNAPIDFLRPPTWRRSENKASDRFISRLAEKPVGGYIGELLARMGQTCRVSFRCRRR